MALEDLFAQKVDEWKTHCYNVSHRSFTNYYLDCEAYHDIIAMGPQVLPLIYQELQKEPPSREYFQKEIERLKVKVFGTTDITLSKQEFNTLEQDKEYQQFTHKYLRDTIGDIGFRWSYVIKEIAPEFRIAKGKEGSNAPIEDLGCGFVSIKDDLVIKAILDWLDKNMDKYTTTTKP